LHEYNVSVFFELLFKAVTVPRTFFQEHCHKITGEIILNNLKKVLVYFDFIEVLSQANISPGNSAKGSAYIASQERSGP